MRRVEIAYVVQCCCHAVPVFCWPQRLFADEASCFFGSRGPLRAFEVETPRAAEVKYRQVIAVMFVVTSWFGIG